MSNEEMPADDSADADDPSVRDHPRRVMVRIGDWSEVDPGNKNLQWRTSTVKDSPPM